MLIGVRGFVHVKVEVTSYGDIGRNDSDLLKEGGKFIEENGWGEFVLARWQGMVDCDPMGGCVKTGHLDVDEFDGPERCVIDSFGFDGGLEEDAHTTSLASGSWAAVEGGGAALNVADLS